MIFSAIADRDDNNDYPVTFMCDQLGVSRSGYHALRARTDGGPSARAVAEDQLRALIVAIHDHLRGNPDRRRVLAQSRAQGVRVSLPRLQRLHRLMRGLKLTGRHPKAWKRTTIAGNEPCRHRTSSAGTSPPQRPTRGGAVTSPTSAPETGGRTWLLSSTCTPAPSSGYAVATHLRTDLVAQFCARNGVRRSLGRTGIRFDDAVSETFFATYKKELIHTRPWPTVKDLKRATFDWIENYSNTIRRHSTLDHLPPREVELGYRHIHQIADFAA